MGVETHQNAFMWTQNPPNKLAFLVGFAMLFGFASSHHNHVIAIIHDTIKSSHLHNHLANHERSDRLTHGIPTIQELYLGNKIFQLSMILRVHRNFWRNKAVYNILTNVGRPLQHWTVQAVSLRQMATIDMERNMY
jgi:hypothetical protein